MGTYTHQSIEKGSPETSPAGLSPTGQPYNCVKLDQLVDDIHSLYNNKETSDVVFLVGEKNIQIHAHKVLLWARCQHFKKLYSDAELCQKLTSQCVLKLKYHHYDPDIFSRLIRYIYTGQVSLDESSVFSFILMAKEFGLPELLSLAEDYVASKLCVRNACLFLKAALHLDKLNTSIEKNGESFTEVCLRFIEDNAEECSRSKAWLELPKPAIIKLISSHKFGMEEDLVWESVLSWARHTSGIPPEKSPKLWNLQEKQLIAQTLDGVTEHIKLFLISSQLFAEEVEPTGIVPMETVLERYRYAAVVSPSDRTRHDIRLLPRTMQPYFPDSAILCDNLEPHQMLLNQWYGNIKQTWHLLYRGSRDGFSAENFHRCCDGFAPTYVVLKGGSGSVCGGFSDVPWSSNTGSRGQYIPSHRYGPTFGGGADICIASDCNNNMESYSNFPHSYTAEPRERSVLMGDSNFNITDYEVFTVQ